MSQTPSLATHIAETADLPGDDHGNLVGRADLPTPSLWQSKVKVTHKVTGQQAVIFRINHDMHLMRLFYPDENRLSTRTEWEQCANWKVEVTFSPAELARQAAQAKLEDDISKLDPSSIGLARVLCDDPDPNKALAKLGLLVQSGLLKPMSAEVAEALVADPRITETKPRAPKAKPEPKPE